MALFVGSSLAKVGLLIRDDAESAFHPWWLTLQDYSLYSIILVGELFGRLQCARSDCIHKLALSVH